MSDIAEKLLAAIEAAEGAVSPLRMGTHYVGPRTDAERAVLRRCAADRKIVALLRTPDPHGPDEVCENCRTLYLLAEGYGVTP